MSTLSQKLRDTRADVTKIERKLGYKAKVSFKEGLEKTIKWYKSKR